MGTFQTSSGERIKKSVIDARVREAKAAKIEEMMDEHGYVFCEEEGCGKNASSGERIDCSHTISVSEAQNTGRTELAWDTDNIKMRCRTCHSILDNLYLGNPNK